VYWFHSWLFPSCCIYNSVSTCVRIKIPIFTLRRQHLYLSFLLLLLYRFHSLFISAPRHNRSHPRGAVQIFYVTMSLETVHKLNVRPLQSFCLFFELYSYFCKSFKLFFMVGYVCDMFIYKALYLYSFIIRAFVSCACTQPLIVHVHCTQSLTYERFQVTLSHKIFIQRPWDDFGYVAALR